MSVRSDRLLAIRTNLEVIVADQTAAWVTAGCPTTFAVDGESYDWNNWLAGKMEAIEKLSTLIQGAQPFAIRSRARG